MMNDLFRTLPLLTAAALLTACSTEVPPMPPAPTAALSVAAIRSDSDQRFSVLLDGATGNDIFATYATDRPSPRGGNFTRRMNFTGVAWDDARSATLVSPEHVVMAAHYARAVGTPLVFHDRRGRPQRRVVAAVVSLAGLADVTVGRLDSPLPDSVRPYRLLPPSAGYSGLEGCLAVVTDQRRKAFIHEIGTVSGNGIHFRLPAASRVPAHLTKRLVSGDSGNPSFLLVGGELVLIETHTAGGPGAGPFLSAPPVFAAINGAMSKLGGGQQLRTVPLAGGL
jgi:hypothetical protein